MGTHEKHAKRDSMKVGIQVFIGIQFGFLMRSEHLEVFNEVFNHDNS